MANIEIGGRLHSTATGNVVTGANEVLDDTKNKKQSVINAEVDETIGDDNTEGTIKGRIKTAEGKLDTLNGNSSTSGSVAKAVADAKTELIGGATSNGNTLKKVEDRTATLETAVGSNGSVDQRIAAAKSEVIGDAASDYNTLGKLEDKIQAEASARESAVSTEAQARQDAITAETNRATTRENQIYDLVHTPEQHYVTVATYAELANIASPSDDTVYRVSSYNGKTSQVDNTVYSEYGYDGTNFVFLCVKSQIDEVYDISAHHSNNTYVDLAAALDGGNNIPQELRKGGMSVKFVQTDDNKYVQYRLMAQTFSTTVSDWQGVDDEPTAGSDNLVKSGYIAKLTGKYQYSGIAANRPTYVISGGIDIKQGKNFNIEIVFSSAISSEWTFGIRKQDDSSIYNFAVPSGTTTFKTNYIPNVTYDDARVRVYTTENDKTFSFTFTEVSSIESVEKNSLAIQNLLGEKGKETAFSGSRTFVYNSSLGKYVIDFPITFSYNKELPATFFVKSGNSIFGTTIYIYNSNYNTIRTYNVTETDYCNIALDNNSAYLRLVSDNDLGTINAECIIGTYGSFIDYYISAFGLSFGGLVTPSSSIDLGDTDVFYMANTAGRYSNFVNDLLLTHGDIVLFVFNKTTKRWYYQFVIDGEVHYNGLHQIKGAELAQGLWNADTGRVSYHANRAISPWIYVERGTKIVNSTYCQIVLFDLTKTYQSNAWKDVNSTTYIQETGYLRLVFVTEEGQTDYSNLDNSVNIISANAYQGISKDRIETTKYGDFVRGYYNSGGTISSHANRASTNVFYKVKKGDFVSIDSKNYQFQVLYWDESKTWLNQTSKWCRLEYIYPQYNNYTVGQIVIPADGYINVCLASVVADSISDSEIAGMNNLIKIGHVDSDYYNDKARKVDTVDIVYKKPRFVNTTAKVSQAGTFIDDNLWLFGETSEPVYVINPNTGAIISQKTQSLGHFSNADYNEVTDTLLSCAEYDSKIYLQLYKSPADKSTLARTDTGYLAIDITSLITNIGTWILNNYAPMWGEDKDVVYLMLGATESSTGVESVYSNEHKIYKLQLGLGDNDLSNTGFGTFVSGKAETEYNGTGQVLLIYIGNIYEGIDTITNLDHRPYVQDAEYDGDIFIGFGIREHNFLRIRLDDETQSFRVIKNYQHKFYNYDRSTQLFYEPEVTAIYNGRLYCGSRNQYITPDSVLLSFEL